MADLGGETVLFSAAEELEALAAEEALEGILLGSASGGFMAPAVGNLVEIGIQDQKAWNASGNVWDPNPWGPILPTEAAWENKKSFQPEPISEGGAAGMVQKKKQLTKPAPKSRGQKALTKPSNPSPTVLSVSQPAAKGVVSRTAKPRMMTTSSGVRVRHREYLGDVISTGTGYTLLLNLMLAPGNPGSFPWLSTVAERYEEYVIRKLSLEYVSESSTATTGVVMIGFDRNAGRQGPSNKAAFLQDQDALRVPPWQSARMSLDCDGVRRFTNTALKYGAYGSLGSNNLLTGNVDPKTGSIGNLFIATSGVAAGTVGEVYVDYEIEFFNPTLVLPPSSWMALNITANSGTTQPFANVSTDSTLYGNVSVTFTATTISMLLSGAVIICITSATSAATAATTVTCSGASIAEQGSSKETGGFNTILTLTGINGPTYVTLTMSSYTNLIATPSYPFKMRIAPFDRTLTNFSA